MLVYLILLFFSNPQIPQKVETLSLEFKQVLTDNETKQITEGLIYYQAPARVFVEIRKPLKQIIDINEHVMIVYHVDRKKAFRFTSEKVIPPAFVMSLLNSMKPDYGLSEAGYKLVKHEKRAHLLRTYWLPPQPKQKLLRELILDIDGDKLVYAKMVSHDGKTVTHTDYQNHLKSEQFQLPTQIHTQTVIQKESKTIHDEWIYYSHVNINGILPESVLNFNLPEDVVIKEVQ
jgi:outer membrane lipoprotein-sorting protein